MMPNSELTEKIKDYQVAMQKYHQNSIYQYIELAVSTLVIFFQGTCLFNLIVSYNGTNPLYLIPCFILAYIATDFINGFAHMYMDNNTHYRSCVGPFIAAFHLHHANPRYVDKPVLKIYFFESGTKFWLLLYLIILCTQQARLPFALNFSFVCGGILSSFAEVSHYLAHHSNKNNRLVQWLQKHYVLLSIEHHAPHHLKDNINYAFLNGFTDPFLNRISRQFYKGYKTQADLHTLAYIDALKKSNSTL